MSENNKPGREPFERIKVYQDFCQLEYGVGACYAGANNLILWSEDYSNAYWETTGSASFDNGDIVTTSDGVNLTLATLPSGSNLLKVDNDFNYPVFPGDIVQASFYFRTNAAAEQLRFAVAITTDDSFGTIGFSVNTDDATEDFSNNAFSTLIAKGVEHISGDDYRCYIIAELNNVRPAWFLNNVFLSSTSTGTIVYAGGLSVSKLPVASTTPMAYRKTESETVPVSSPDRCYHTRATCPVPDVYDRGELELKFCKNQQVLPAGEYHIPSVTGVSITPGSINPGGSDSNTSAMGKRATISVQFEDHAHSDLLVDPYRDQRGYKPMDRGTFWTKWRARNPYYMHRRIVYESGYMLDGVVVDSINRTFFITGFSGPDSSGRVTLSGKDVLTLAANDKAKAPAASTGSLDGDLTDVATSLTVTPSGVGDLEYPMAGWVRVGKEVMEFTRTGDVFTVTRAQYGTVADEHEEGDSVQLCLQYESEAPADILYDLLNNYAAVPAEYLDKTQWDAEQLSYLPRKYSAIITEPEGVTDLVAEMCQQMYFTTWFDERESMVKMRAVRPAQGDAIYELTDNANLVQDSISWVDKADELITQVWVYYGQSNPTEKLDQGDNYAALDVIASPDSEGEDRNNLSRIKTIYSRWIDSANGAAAIDLGNRILARYASAPRECTFKLDAKDRDLWLADFVQLTNRLRTDFTGNPVPVNMQVFEAQETTAGTTFTYKAKEYIEQLSDGDDVQDPNIRNIIISADQLNVNLRELHDSQYAPPTGVETITCTIRSGVAIGGYAADDAINIPYAQRDTGSDFYDGGTGSVSGLTAGQIPILQRRGISSVRVTDIGDPYPEGGGNADFEIQEYPISTAFVTGDWPSGVTLSLVIEGGARILGEGGNGCTHALSDVGIALGTTVYEGAAGGDGGHAMGIQYAISITNGGVISGGGGGGGGTLISGGNTQLYPGGGGGGLENSDTSTVKGTGLGGATIREASPGSSTAGGSGAAIITGGIIYLGGNGGSLAADGQKQEFFFAGGGDGGQAGDAIAEGADMVTWVNKGDVRGAENI